MDHRLRAEIEDRGQVQLGDQLDQLATGITEVDDLLAGGAVARELALPAFLPLRLDRTGLDRLDPADALDQQRVVGRAALELLLDPRL